MKPFMTYGNSSINKKQNIMKNRKYTLNTLLLIALAAAAFIVTSSFSRPGKYDKVDAQFVSRAAEINLEEIQYGQLAQQKGMTADVKELGSMMEKAHTQWLSELTSLANKKGISIPTSVKSEGREEYKELKNKSEKRFNEEYCELTIKNHKKAIELFEEVSEDSKDSEIKAWALATLPVLRIHLTNAKACKEKCEKL
jgi:putative membrane protein